MVCLLLFFGVVCICFEIDAHCEQGFLGACKVGQVGPFLAVLCQSHHSHLSQLEDVTRVPLCCAICHNSLPTSCIAYKPCEECVFLFSLLKVCCFHLVLPCFVQGWLSSQQSPLLCSFLSAGISSVHHNRQQDLFV